MKTIPIRKQLTNFSYHRHDFLLLQFVLSEFLSAQAEVKNLRRLFLEFCEVFRGRAGKKNKEEALKNLNRCTEQLSGSSYNYMRIFSWGQEGGFLNKLNHYCALFSQQSPPRLKAAKRIYEEVSRGRLACIELHDLTFSLQGQPQTVWKEYIQQIRQLEEKISKKMSLFSGLLPAIIKEYADNENVIFFLLRHKHEFDELISKEFITDLFTANYPGGSGDAEKLLLKKYRKRGFFQLLPIISEKFRNI